jgi:hypothetical protein
VKYGERIIAKPQVSEIQGKFKSGVWGYDRRKTVILACQARNNARDRHGERLVTAMPAITEVFQNRPSFPASFAADSQHARAFAVHGLGCNL